MTPLFPLQPHAILLAEQLDDFSEALTFKCSTINCVRNVALRLLMTLQREGQMLESPQCLPERSPLDIVEKVIVPKLKRLCPGSSEVIDTLVELPRLRQLARERYLQMTKSNHEVLQKITTLSPKSAALLEFGRKFLAEQINAETAIDSKDKKV